MRVYCSMSQNFDTFNTPHDALFLLFGVPNVKYSSFGTPDENALIVILVRLYLFHCIMFFKKYF